MKRPLKPVHERMVLLRFMGKGNDEIQKILAQSGIEYTTQQICNVLNDPQSAEILAELKLRLRNNLLGEVESDLIEAARLGAKRIRETMEIEVPNRTNSVAFVRHQDNLGAKLLERLGYFGDEEEAEGKSRGVAVPVETSERLTRALELSDRVAREDYVIVSDDATPRTGTDG